MRLLVIEDDVMIGERLQKSLSKSGHAVDWLRDGASADTALRAQAFDMVLLDLGLPKRSGIDVLQRLRSRGNRVPVIILTARDAIQSRIEGLDSGADDYLVKPFALDELEARIRAVERRHQGQASTLLTFGQLTCNPVAKEVRFDEKPVMLSGREYEVLYLLMRRPGAIVARREIEESLYNWRDKVESNTIEVHVHRLRQKLDARIIRTVRGLGYQLVAL
jgi:two-component system OmpR family response regulator/two-component system response regulator QseB